jgi:hypothetical protein
MTSLAGVQLDPNVEESTGAFTVIPAGKYKACLVSDELRDNSAGTGKVLMVKIQIMDGQFAGEVLTDYINITNANPKAQAIGQGTLKRICNLCGVPYPPQDTAGLMGKPLGIDVKVERFTSNTTGKELDSNKIKSYGPPPTQTQAAAQQAPAQPVQQASGW